MDEYIQPPDGLLYRQEESINLCGMKEICFGENAGGTPLLYEFLGPLSLDIVFQVINNDGFCAFGRRTEGNGATNTARTKRAGSSGSVLCRMKRSTGDE